MDSAKLTARYTEAWGPLTIDLPLIHKNIYTVCLYGACNEIWQNQFEGGARGFICSRFDHLIDFGQMSNSLFFYEKLITCFVLMIWQILIVRRFDNLTHSDRFWLKVCQIFKTSNQNSWVRLCGPFVGDPNQRVGGVRQISEPNTNWRLRQKPSQ